MRRYLRMGALAAGMTSLALFGLVAPANAEEPQPETRTVTTHVVDREDHGHGTPPPATWALDTFDRTVVITGGPAYVPRQDSLVAGDSDAPEVPADIDKQVAEAKKEPKPEFTVCDLVKQFHLRWNYHAEVTDKGTFVTQAGETLSPNAGAALLGDVPGTFTGGFTADFVAPAHWCTFDASKLDDKTIKGDDAPATSDWVKCLFGGFRGHAINDDWSWTYKTCVEKWTDAADNNDGQDEDAGDITGKPCVTPSPSPSTTPPPVVVETAQLPVTGASVSSVVVIGGGLVVLGIAMLVGLGMTRRRQQA